MKDQDSQAIENIKSILSALQFSVWV